MRLAGCFRVFFLAPSGQKSINAALKWIQWPDPPDIPWGTHVVSTGNPVSCKSGLNSLINTRGGVLFYRISTLCNYASQTAALRER